MTMTGRGDVGGALIFNAMLSLMALFSENPMKNTNTPKILKDQEKRGLLLAHSDAVHPQDIYQKHVHLEKRITMDSDSIIQTSRGNKTIALLSLHTTCQRPVMVGDSRASPRTNAVLTCKLELVSSFPKISTSSSSNWWWDRNRKPEYEQLDVFEGLLSIPDVCLNREQDFIISFSIPFSQPPPKNYSLEMKECQFFETRITQVAAAMPSFRLFWSWTKSFTADDDTYFLGSETMDVQQLLMNEQTKLFLYLWTSFRKLQVCLFISVAISCTLLCVNVKATVHCCFHKPVFPSKLCPATNKSLIGEQSKLQNVKRYMSNWRGNCISTMLSYFQYYSIVITAMQWILSKRVRLEDSLEENETPVHKLNHQISTQNEAGQRSSPTTLPYLLDTMKSIASTIEFSNRTKTKFSKGTRNNGKIMKKQVHLNQ
jgi:hypothetical protein